MLMELKRTEVIYIFLGPNLSKEPGAGSSHIEFLAMKTVHVKRKENRELMILKKLNHNNITNLRNHIGPLLE